MQRKRIIVQLVSQILPAHRRDFPQTTCGSASKLYLKVKITQGQISNFVTLLCQQGKNPSEHYFECLQWDHKCLNLLALLHVMIRTGASVRVCEARAKAELIPLNRGVAKTRK